MDKRSEEHTSELQSHLNLVCRLLLEKKKKRHRSSIPFFFFFNDTATTEIYTLSLHDALPIYFANALLIKPDATGHLSINYHGPRGTYPYYSIADVVQHKFAPGTFKDKIIDGQEIGRAHV